MVQRYRHGDKCGDEYTCGPVKSITGDYVEYDDYFKLELLCRQLAETCQDVYEEMKYDAEHDNLDDVHQCMFNRINNALEATKKVLGEGK